MKRSVGYSLRSCRVADAVPCRSTNGFHGSPLYRSAGLHAKTCRCGSLFSRSNGVSSMLSVGVRKFSLTPGKELSQDGTSGASPTARPSGLRLLDKKRSKKQEAESGTTSGKKKTGTIFGQDSSLPIRARFAPSPTGYMHLGSLRTAALNNMAALASNGGAFVLRIEDTDRSRFVDDAEERLVADLKWAGLKWDEGPDCGGPYGPYRQSERLHIYKEHAQKLIEQGHAYRCFCSQEQLDAQKTSLHEAGQSTAYPKTCRSIPSEESDRRAASGESHMLRFKGDSFGRPKVRDTIFGPYQKGEDEEDFVILKSDGYPTYHLANVVDDHLMRITHVIRGEEWLISTPKHIALYNAFGWQPPSFSHLALLVNQDGSKLSKRSNARGISDKRDAGTAPIPLITWLVSQGGSTKLDKAMSNHPRDIESLASVMKFESLKRVPIRVDYGQLDSHELAYVKLLAGRRISSTPAKGDQLLPSEVAILERYCVPLLREIYSTRPRKRLVPSLESLVFETGHDFKDTGSAKAAHGFGDAALPLYHMLALPQVSSLSPSVLLDTFRYIIWQVEDEVYQSSVARWSEEAGRIPAVGVLDELQQCLADESCPPEAWLSRLKESNFFQAAGKETVASMYALLRLIATGYHDRPAPPAGPLFLAISREDWKERARRVQSLVSELEPVEERESNDV